MIRKIGIWIVLCFGVCRGVAQVADTLRMAEIRQKLEMVAEKDPAWLECLDVTAGRMPLRDLFQYIARVGEVNLSVKADSNLSVSCNFSRIRIIDMCLFLCREYGLDVHTDGNIVSVYPYLPRPVQETEPEIFSDSVKLSYDLKGHSLYRVVKKISGLTGLHLVLPGELYDFPVRGYVENMPVDEALRTLAVINRLQVYRQKEGFWVFENEKTTEKAPFSYRTELPSGQLDVDSCGRITAFIEAGKAGEVIAAVCEKLHLNYYMLQYPEVAVSLYVRGVDLHTFFNVLLAGTAFTWSLENGIYLFGAGGKETSLSTVKIFSLRNRTVEKIGEWIPDALKKEVQIRVFPDLNSVIASGERGRVDRIGEFLKEIDRNVPLITIEVMIVDVTKGYAQETGITAGLGNPPPKTSGTFSPGLDLQLSSATINHLLNSFNGFGSIRLGKVSSDFYLNLKFLEEAGMIELHSTPKLSTLNGHEAVLSSGEIRYYKEVTNNIIGSQNPMQSESYTWKDVEAKMKVKITPFVTLRNLITLDIEIEQSEFTDREEKNAPPGRSMRSFKSIIKVNNGEMVLLGGIEQNTRKKASSGLPWIARIPLLKWLFGSSANQKSSHKLNVFIRPTVVE